jgi:hypothetical protein
MQYSPQVQPVSNLQRNTPAVLRQLKSGPVFLSQRGVLTAALISINEWDRTVKLIEDLQAQLSAERRLRLSNQRFAEAQADSSLWVSPEEYDQQLAQNGLSA